MELDRIYNEDCISENINEGMNRIADNSVDMILCDLPYGTTKCNWDTIIPFDRLWEQYNRVIKDNGAIVLFGIEPFSSLLRISNLANYRYDVIWEKPNNTNFMRLKKEFGKRHENISIFYKHQPTYNPQMEKGKPYKDKRTTRNSWEGVTDQSKRPPIENKGTRYPSSVQRFNQVNRGTVHPTQKPVDLLEYLIKTYTNENEIVLDNCIGSGSTAIACINTNRRYIGFETNKKYYDIALRRLSEL